MMPAARCRASMSLWSWAICVCLAAMASEIWLNRSPSSRWRVRAVTGLLAVRDCRQMISHEQPFRPAPALLAGELSAELLEQHVPPVPIR